MLEKLRVKCCKLQKLRLRLEIYDMLILKIQNKKLKFENLESVNLWIFGKFVEKSISSNRYNLNL